MSDYDQTKGELCPKCGWAMKFPEEPCRCELERENAVLREWVKEEGKRNDVCTYGILKEVCEDCRCGRRKEAKP